MQTSYMSHTIALEKNKLYDNEKVGKDYYNKEKQILQH